MLRVHIIIISAIFSFTFAAITLADDIGSKLEQKILRTPDRGKINQAEAAGGIKEAMAQGVNRAIKQLGREDGFNKDPMVRILVPKQLRKVADLSRQLGAGKKVDQFELSMNRAAEKAIPAAADIFADAVRQMTVQDAINIVRGDEDAGTKFFRRVTEDKLRTKVNEILADAKKSGDLDKMAMKWLGRPSAGSMRCRPSPRGATLCKAQGRKPQTRSPSAKPLWPLASTRATTRDTIGWPSSKPGA